MTETTFDAGRPYAPIPGAPVCEKISGNTGFVESTRMTEQGIQVRVIWGQKQSESWHRLDALKSALQIGNEVREVPYLSNSVPMGLGTVIASRDLGGTQQFLVEFWQRNERLWLPWQNLRFFNSASQRFKTQQMAASDNTERFRLRALSHALEQWNLSTGALETMDIDPLPHQLYLVDRILSSGNLNWMIADDVGLGKTIEVGLLISALKRRGMKRFLLVVPAGLTPQWKEEMRERFGLDDFLIYGRDFKTERSEDWRRYDAVIASMDRLKSESHLENILKAAPWDVIIFDEAHRLTRSQYGEKFSSSERFRLAASLRPRTDAMLLLTGTPHQGKQDRFTALLELLRPKEQQAIRRISIAPEFLRNIIIRNRKADVTDADGNFVFKGKVTRTIAVPSSDLERQFDEQLRHYLLEGYNAGRQGGNLGRAIGFVMTIYRKLAASSLYAILTALKKRRERLLQESKEVSTEDDEGDMRFEGEQDERQAQFSPAKAFFDGELARLDVLISLGNALLPLDSRLRLFMETMLKSVLTKNPDRRVLIFSEYKTTQQYLEKALAAQFGLDKVHTIHGGKTIDQRREAMQLFEEQGQFLVSTEAGGEGLNLQRRCHTMINFDLPWNPMRLVQRVGRLYRYGQQQTVLVFNMQSPHSLDDEILGMMYERLFAVAKDMVTVGDEFRREQLEDDILGELCEALEIETILEDALQHDIQRSQERIDEALRKAKEGAGLQRDLLKYASRYDHTLDSDRLQLTSKHLKAFTEGMFKALEYQFEVVDKGRSWLLSLSPEDARKLGLKTKTRVTTEREVKALKPEAHLLDAQSSLLKFLLEEARDIKFGGLVANVAGLPNQAVINALVRWQNERGVLMRQEYTALCVSEDGTVQINPPEFKAWLLEPKAGSAKLHQQSTVLLEIAQKTLDSRLQDLSQGDLYPSGRWIFSAAWIDDSI